MVWFRVRFDHPENKQLRGLEEQLTTCINELLEKVNSLDTTTIRELSREYKEASLPDDTDFIDDMLYTEYMNILDTSTPAQSAVAEVLMIIRKISCKIQIQRADVKESIMIRCTCKTVQALYDLQQLIDSAKLDQHFSNIMYCLVHEPMKASVRMSLEDFIRCRMSLTDDAG